MIRTWPEREAALHRAAKHARRRAEAMAQGAAASTRGADNTAATRETESRHDPRTFSFSQVQGYEDIPGPLKLEELPAEARTWIWSLLFSFLKKSTTRPRGTSTQYVVGAWEGVLVSKHVVHDRRPLDEWNTKFDPIRADLRHSIETLPFNKVFDLIQFVLRHRECPREFVDAMKHVFSRCRLAYTIDEGLPPTIVPAVTPEEGDAVVGAMQTLNKSGLDGAASHLRRASECIKTRDWAGSVHESIHAVESVARQLDPAASATLGPALKALKQRGSLHPALEEAFNKLYGYTSDEQGIRHARLDGSDDKVGMDEALFMLSACASFSSYLWRKHGAGQAS